MSIFKLHLIVTLWKVPEPILHKTWKTSFWVNYGHFWPKSPRTIFFVKKLNSVTLQIKWHLNFMQKTHTMLNSRYREKCQINRQLNRGYVIRPSCPGCKNFRATKYENGNKIFANLHKCKAISIDELGSNVSQEIIDDNSTSIEAIYYNTKLLGIIFKIK